MSTDILTQFEAFLLTEKLVAANTFVAYKRDIDQFVAYLKQKDIALDQVRAADIKMYLRYLKDEGIQPRSASRKISSIKVLFNYLHDRHAWENPSQDLTFPKIKKGLPKLLTEEEVEKLLAVADDDTSDVGERNRIMLYLLYVSGMRISELISMTLSDVHFDTGFVKISGKGGKERMVPAPNFMFDLLRDYIQRVHQAFTSKDGGKRKTNYLFPIYYGGVVKPITRQAFWIILNSLWSRTGINKTISPHTLRHSLATHMLKNGADLRSLQLILGHERVTTVEIYTHVETSRLREVYNKRHPRSDD